MSVWIVEEYGDDRDSWIVGVYDTKAAAKRHADQIDGHVSEHDVASQSPTKIEWVVVEVDREGSVRGEHTEKRFDDEEGYAHTIYDGVDYYGRGGDWMGWRVCARTREEAIAKATRRAKRPRRRDLDDFTFWAGMNERIRASAEARLDEPSGTWTMPMSLTIRPNDPDPAKRVVNNEPTEKPRQLTNRELRDRQDAGAQWREIKDGTEIMRLRVPGDGTVEVLSPTDDEGVA